MTNDTYIGISILKVLGLTPIPWTSKENYIWGMDLKFCWGMFGGTLFPDIVVCHWEILPSHCTKVYIAYHLESKIKHNAHKAWWSHVNNKQVVWLTFIYLQFLSSFWVFTIEIPWGPHGPQMCKIGSFHFFSVCKSGGPLGPQRCQISNFSTPLLGWVNYAREMNNFFGGNRRGQIRKSHEISSFWDKNWRFYSQKTWCWGPFGPQRVE